MRYTSPPKHPTTTALLMLNELHRFGFEQLRFESYGGHGFGAIFAAKDEVPLSFTDQRFVPAVRHFRFLDLPESLTADQSQLAEKWHELLWGDSKPNHLAGLFVLDFPDIARRGFGADEGYRNWFRPLVPLIEKGIWPITHDNFSHAQPVRELKWSSGPVPETQAFRQLPPENPFLNGVS